jgi:hypothetical protein
LVNEMSRNKFLNDLIALTRPLRELSKQVSEIPWDHAGPKIILRRTNLVSIIERVLAGELSVNDLENWANLLECREDIEFENEHEDQIDNIIDIFANPVLFGSMDHPRLENILYELMQ